MGCLHSLFVSTLLASAALAQWAPVVVPSKGYPERIRALSSAGVAIAHTDTFVVLSGSPRSMAIVRDKGWPHHVTSTVPPGRELYLVPVEHGIAGLGDSVAVLHTGEDALLVAVAPEDRDRLLRAAEVRGLCGAVRVPGEPLRLAREATGRPLAQTVLDNLVPDPAIQALLAQVDPQNLNNTVNRLSAIHTRRSDTAGGVQAQNTIAGWFGAIPGLNVSLHDFDGGADNVIAELPGTVDPSKIVIIGAHYDSYAGGSTARAPGADDNASGTAAVLETARLLSQLPLKYTVRFICFASEEFGLVGSAAYAGMVVARGEDVLAMVNQDMVAYRRPGDPRDLVLITNDTNGVLNAFAMDVGAAYLPTLPLSTGSLSGGTSDHRSFNRRGIPATWPFEDTPHYSPYIHTANDVVGTSANDFALAAESTRLSLALVAELAVPAVMDIRHTPLANTPDPYGPYQVRATVASLVGATIASAQVVGTDARGPFTVPMVRTAAPDEWIADIPGQPAGTTVRYAVEATDSQGGIGRFPESSPLAAGELVFAVGGAVPFWLDDFESGTSGWSHGMVATQDDWQAGTPQGASTDPSSAFSGTTVWANDLGRSGWNGAYQNNVNNWLRSPTIDCTGRTGVHLRLQRWLGVEQGTYDQARILVNGTQVWINPAGADLIDAAWTAMDLDVSAIADNNPAVQIEFRLQSDASVVFGGWNIDDVALTEPAPPFARGLVADTTFLSVGASTSVGLTLDFGAVYAGAPYLMLPGISGSTPGFRVGSVVLPLNPDPVTYAVFESLLNTPSFASFAGTLDAQGTATAAMNVPPGVGAAVVGLTVTVAGLPLNPLNIASNAVDVLIVP